MHSIDRRRFIKGTSSSLLLLSQLLKSRFSVAQANTAAQHGVGLSPWMPGTLDIHHISTGRGSCAFLLCPDGTTLMIDAGSILTHVEPARDKYLAKHI